MGVCINNYPPAAGAARRSRKGFSASFINISKRIVCGSFVLQQAAIAYASSRVEKGTSFLLSQECPTLSQNRFRILANTLNGWDISNINHSFNRIWVRHEGRILAAVMPILELAKLASLCSLEIPDATRFIFEIEDGNLVASKETVPLDAQTNAEVRDRIRSYLSGESEAIPPTLFTEIHRDGTIHLCDDPAGNPIFLKIHNGEAASCSIAGIDFESRTQVKTIKNHRLIGSYHKPQAKIIPVPEKIAAQVCGKVLPPNPTPEIAPPTRRDISKALKAWFAGATLAYPIIERSITGKGQIKLVLIDGLPYCLNGLKKFRKQGLTKVLVWGKDQEIGGTPRKTVYLYKPDMDPEKHPDKWFAFYVLDLPPAERSSPQEVKLENAA
ncbi:MAG: hypothetical protein HQ596_03485 [Candidatus Saganbacteria bacterium]|nr:hypothetical protein [Candidatus Saganbacteria bacterium]